MTKIASIFVCVLLISVVASAQPVHAGPHALSHVWFPQSLATAAGFKCKKVDGKLICGDFGKSGKKDDDDDDDDQPKESKDKVIPKTCGKKVNCEAGFVKLEKPNKYGACCEAREGLPPAKAAEPEKCKFPGMVGTPPNCDCPKDKVFLGYKGCVPCVSICDEACAQQYKAADSCITTKGADACESQHATWVNCYSQCFKSRCPDSGLLGGQR